MDYRVGDLISEPKSALSYGEPTVARVTSLTPPQGWNVNNHLSCVDVRTGEKYIAIINESLLNTTLACI